MAPLAPLPRLQLFIVFLIQFAEPITALVIFPFIIFAVRRSGITGGDEAKAGYYAGIIESCFFITEFLTVYAWARASDRWGRRPVLLLGPLGLCIATVVFGLSKSFWLLIASRAAQGVFNGNIGVSKTILVEISPPSRLGRVISLMPLVWNLGVTVGPIIGGTLANPGTQWPEIFGRSRFFLEHPYFLPCAVAGGIAFLSFLFAFLGLQETKEDLKQKASGLPAEAADNISSYGTVESETNRNPKPKGPPPLRVVLNPRLLKTLVSYGFLSFMDMSLGALLPLIYSTSPLFGGLGLRPNQIGTILGVYGLCGALTQLFITVRLLDRFGTLKVFRTGLVFITLALCSLCAVSYFARRAGGVDGLVVVFVILQLSCALWSSMAYASAQLLLVESITNAESLATTNSLSHMTATSIRAIAPTLASSLFAASVDRNILGGYMAFVVLGSVDVIGICLSFNIPSQPQVEG